MALENDTRVPVTILTGFLGSGKTTLLNELIRRHPQKEVAIIENEFGKIPLDHHLIVNSKESIFELSQGCICCTLNQELGNLLEELINRNQPFNHLIIETTGIADPAGVASAFLSQQRRQSYFRLDATICLVDTLHIEQILREEAPVAGPQIAFADMILLNKADLITHFQKEDLDRIVQLIRNINPYAAIRSGGNGDFGKNDLLNLQAHKAENILEKTYISPANQEFQHGKIVSQSFAFQDRFDQDKFKTWIYKVLNFQSENLYRVKGIFAFAGVKEKVIFQSVKNQFVFSPAENWPEGESSESKIVFIGKDLNRSVLERRLKACLVK